MKPRRIAYVLNIFPKVSETFIAGELAELRRRGIELRILSLLPPRDEIQHEVVRRAELNRWVEYEVSKFAGVVREFKPDLLHAHFAREATDKARELSTQTGVPFTFTAHGYDIHRKPPPDFNERALAARAVVTVSQANADYIHRAFAVPQQHIHVIPCGVDTDWFSPAFSNDPGQPPVVLCVARLVAVKNLALLLDACALLRDRGVSFRCVIIGEGPLRGELEAKRASLKLEDFLQMPGAGQQENVLQWWRRATAGVLSSENEGMPVCLMEAAACSVPVAATSVGGIPELVGHGETGLLVPPGDAAALATALEQLLADAELRARLGEAARRRAVATFSVTRQVDSLLALWTGVINAPGTMAAGAPLDGSLPTLAAALDFENARHEFKRRLPRLSIDGKLRLKNIRLTRHKPGKRALVEYDVEIRRPGRPEETVTLLGKLRVRRSGNEGYRQLETIWKAGFHAHSVDGISVPEPIGVISRFQMWFQRKVSGVPAEELLAGTQGVPLAWRVAEAIFKLHRANLLTERQHTMADELRILRACFEKVSEGRPDWAPRLTRLMAGCERLGAGVPAAATCGIHRDFYPAQVIVECQRQRASTPSPESQQDGTGCGNAVTLGRLWIIDFDLFCHGDPGLDVGNFLGHITEQALRERGDAAALRAVEQALEHRYVELAGEQTRAAIRAYAELTLARHIFLSALFPERQHLTEALLGLCERRVLGNAT